ncbi:hypothetical protein D0T49_05675 [Paludibacter sp. 221]|uniref:hypothetical protein n=1 Tax=Paludibacter sp. 221 TaxID=2302939 RepID=UPI0013D0444A|nr:hypothetical protein [Paludibacter sp. 221]NDV46531.1 hypothetical protein [Paludibacter sp. 221]
MFWIKFGILITGFLYAGILPYTLRKALKCVEIDLSVDTLSMLSISELYGKKYRLGYTRLLFAAAILNYFFFGLLSEFYNLGDFAPFIKYINYSGAFLAILAFISHNIAPYRFEFLHKNIQRILHNLFAVLVFLSLPTLIVLFEIARLPSCHFIAITGLVIIGIVAILTAWSILKNGVNGFSELLFINGISIWSIFTTIVTILR